MKLYFMLGLPTEKPEDVRAIAALAEQVLDLYYEMPKEQRKRRPHITVSTAFFIPKPCTPFQWVGQMSQETLMSHQQLLSETMTNRAIRYQWHDFETAHVEAVLARGDRRLAPVLESVVRQGARLDAWHEHFRYERWVNAMNDAGLTFDFYAARERDVDEVFPWEHISCGVTRDFLWREYERSLIGETTPECRAACSSCGAQSFGGGVCYES